MIKVLIISFFICSCVTTKRTVILDGSESHADKGQVLTLTRWTIVNGLAKITNPDSLKTTAIVNGNVTFVLFGQQTDGQSGKDTMKVIILKLN